MADAQSFGEAVDLFGVLRSSFLILTVAVSTPSQAWFSSLGTFALCDGDFS